jgi:S1-C subfamily serine protease
MHEPLDGPAWDDADEQPPASPADRPWRHPSEVGLAERGRADRRRGSALAAGLVVAGVSLLVVGAVLGLAGARDTDRDVAASAPRDLIEPTVAAVATATPDGRRTTTGLVLDRDGHLVVSAASVAGATEVWATCGDRAPQSARVLGVDPAVGVALLHVGEPAGRPVVEQREPTAGTDVLAVRTTGSERPLQLGPARVRPGSADAAAGFGVLTELTDGAVFDHGGRLLGLRVDGAPAEADRAGATMVEARAVAATTVVGAARRLAERAAARGSWIGMSGGDEPGGAGAAVSDVVPGGPAEVAGLRAGDVVVAVDGDDVTGMDQLAAEVRGAPIGSTLPLVVRRDGQRVDLDVVTAPRPTS